MSEEVDKLSVEKHNLLKQASILTLLKKYCKFLLDEKIVDNKDAALAKIGTVTTVALDRGDITQVDVEYIVAALRDTPVSYQRQRQRKCEYKFLEHTLVDEIEALTNKFQNTGSDMEEFKELNQAYLVYNAKLEALLDKYFNFVKTEANKFLVTYEKLFDPQYIEFIGPVLRID